MDLIRTCSHCGQRNRVSTSRLQSEALCGQCKSAILPLREPLEVDPATFDAIVQDSTLPILVDFWASWCGPCRMAAPEVHQTAANMAGRAIVLKVDTERHPQLAARYNVHGIPNFLVLNQGQIQFQQAGVVPHNTMEQWLNQAAQHKRSA